MKIVREDLGAFRPHLKAAGLGSWRWERALPLTSQPGQLRLGFFGSGAAFSAYQHQSNLVIIKGKTCVFIDAGTKFTLRISEFGLNVRDIQHLIISHSHADHCGSVEEVGLRWRYEGSPSSKQRPTLYVPQQYASILWDETLRGGMAYSERETDDSYPHLTLNDFFSLGTLKPATVAGDRQAWEFSVGHGDDAIHFLMYTVPHIPQTSRTAGESFFSSGLVIDGRVLFSGDTRMDSEIFETIGRDCETIFHDCQSYSGGVHASYAELKTLPPQVRNKIYLYHCDDAMRPLDKEGRLAGVDVRPDGFAGYAETLPVFYEF